jgi:hypothetical protein
MAVVYRHVRLDTNEVFYVGIGKTIARAYQKSKTKRSIFWLNIINKTNYKVEILAEDLSWEEACEMEKKLIYEYGRKDLGTGTLVNLTDGGENPPLMLGDKNYSKTIEGRRKISDRMKGKVMSDETKSKLSKNAKEKGFVPPSQKGKTKSIETKIKHSNSISGGKHCNAKKIICIENGKIWDSIKECAKDTNISYSTLVNKLNGFRKNDTTFKYLSNIERFS